MAKSDYILCQCSICCEKEVLDRETNQIVPGVQLKKGEWQSHQLEDQGLKTHAKRRALVSEPGDLRREILKGTAFSASGEAIEELLLIG
jgi:hypothetical protein